MVKAIGTKWSQKYQCGTQAVGTACANLQGYEDGSVSSKVGAIPCGWIVGRV